MRKNENGKLSPTPAIVWKDLLRNLIRLALCQAIGLSRTVNLNSQPFSRASGRMLS